MTIENRPQNDLAATESLSPDIYLASSSPRRKELLNQIGVQFKSLEVLVDETPFVGETGRELVMRLAQEKAIAGRDLAARTLDIPILGADTVVVHQGKILGKPVDKLQTVEMLSQLSGSTQEVMSAICTVQNKRKCSMLSINRVTFRKITGVEMERYWATGEPVDKAGAFAIQGLAAVFIENLQGSFSAVMGLPLYETSQLLGQFGVRSILDE